MIEWMLYANNEGEKEPLVGGEEYWVIDIYELAKGYLKRKMKDGSLFLLDQIEWVIGNDVAFMGTIGELTREEIPIRRGW